MSQLSEERKVRLDEDVEVAAKLQSQWPKQCAKCQRRYYRAVEGERIENRWDRLPIAQDGKGRSTDAFGDYEFRECPCGNTLTVLMAINDLSKE